MCRFMILGSILLTLVIGHPASAQPCDDLPDTIEETLQLLYRYASVSNIPYDGKTSYSVCTIRESGRQIIPSEDSIMIPSTKRASCIAREYTTYVDDHGVTYLTCPSEAFDPQLALTWRERRKPAPSNEEEAFREKVDVLLDVVAIIPQSLLGKLPKAEQLGFVELTRVPPLSGSNGIEKMMAIKGTKMPSLLPKLFPELRPTGGVSGEQIMASVNDLMGKSCVFPISAVVVSFYSHDPSISHLSVIGHSLGGAASQYVAKDHASTLGDYSSRDYTFRAYAFNAVGLDGTAAANLDLSALHNYYVKDEIVSWLGRYFDRKQIGNTLQYVPPESDMWNPPGLKEAFRRHSLDVVQKSLCECMNRSGSLVATRQ